MVVKKEYTTKIISENPREGKGIIEGYRYLDSHELTNSLKGFYINELLKQTNQIKRHKFYFAN